MPQKVKIKQEEIVEKKMAKDETKIKRDWPMTTFLKNFIN